MAEPIVTRILLAAGICNAGQVLGTWEISIGPDYVGTFHTDLIPGSIDYPALAVNGRPHEIKE